MNSLRRPAAAAFACGLGAWLAAAPAAAAEWGASAGTGVIYTDNLERTADGSSVAIAATDLAAQFVTIGDAFDVDMEGSLIWREYLESGYESDLLPQFRGEANWAPAPEYFVWTFRDNFGQVALSPGEILQPVDRQDINVFATGPAVTIPLGPRLSVLLAGLYSDVYYEEDDVDYTRESGSLTVEREISLNQAGYFRFFAHRTDYKQQSLGGYDYAGYFLGYEGLGSRTSLTAEVGIEELRDAGVTEDGLYVNLYLDRALGERTRAALAYIRHYADSADIFALSQDLEPVLGGASNVVVSSDPVWLELASLDFGWDGVRTSAHLVTFWSTEDADSTVQPDREIYGAGVTASRWFTDRARLGASVFATREEWTGPVEQLQNDVTAALEFEIQIGSKLSLLTVFETFTRNDSPADYDENRVTLQVRYTPRRVQDGFPTYYARRMNRRFVVGGTPGAQEDDASRSRDRP